MGRRAAACALLLLLLSACSGAAGVTATGVHGGSPGPLAPGWSAQPTLVRAVARGAGPTEATRIEVRPAPWMRAVDGLIDRRPVSVSVVVDGARLYGHLAGVPRAPASNEKLLLSMAALDRLGPDFRIATEVAARDRVHDGVVGGNLYLIGHGDPETGAEDIHRLAVRLRDAGLTRVDGSIVGDTSAFLRDRSAPGWHRIALSYIGLPTALSYQANADAGGFVFDPERRASIALTAELRSLGIPVAGSPRAFAAPAGLTTIAGVRSASLADILRRQNVTSNNLDAETLSKLLATEVLGRRGSIADGAAVIEAWADDHGADTTLHDACGLSYADRISAAALAALLDDARPRPWGDELRASLAAPGEGTLSGRLSGLPVRAKTGTLIGDISALSGYVRLRDGRWASFSILSQLPKDEAVSLEDAIVRAIATSA
jgi:D-alanyl-D-alanine carboxypeptidase